MYGCTVCSKVHMCGEKCDSQELDTQGVWMVCTCTGICMSTVNISTKLSDNISRSTGNSETGGGFGMVSLGYVIKGPRKRPSKASKIQRRRRRVEDTVNRLFFSKARGDLSQARKRQVDQEWVRAAKKRARKVGWGKVGLYAILSIRQMVESKSFRLVQLDETDPALSAAAKRLVKLVMTAWHKFSTSNVWTDCRIDIEFDSFVLGYITLCREGKDVDGYQVIPRVELVNRHLPPATLLSKLQGKSKSSKMDCVDKRRIMTGQNAVLAALAYSVETTSVSELAVVEPQEATGKDTKVVAFNLILE